MVLLFQQEFAVIERYGTNFYNLFIQLTSQANVFFSKLGRTEHDSLRWVEKQQDPSKAKSFFSRLSFAVVISFNSKSIGNPPGPLN